MQTTPVQPEPITKTLEFDIDPEQGFAMQSASMTLAGHRAISMVRNGRKAVVTFQEITIKPTAPMKTAKQRREEREDAEREAILCPVCGHGYYRATHPCNACKFEADKHKPDQHRQEWLEAGTPWRSPDLLPLLWSPTESLARLALKVTLSRVKGRPPRVAADPPVLVSPPTRFVSSTTSGL